MKKWCEFCMKETKHREVGKRELGGRITVACRVCKHEEERVIGPGEDFIREMRNA